jgi:hypothetical protein
MLVLGLILVIAVAFRVVERVRRREAKALLAPKNMPP